MMHQPEASYRLDQPTHAHAEPAQGEKDGEKDIAGKAPPGWIGLPDCVIGGTGPGVLVPLVLLHPEVGVALLGLPAAAGVAAETALRQRLEAARFAAIFPGHLPVVTLGLLPEAGPGSLDGPLRAAFATQPPLKLAGGDGWVSVVRRALRTRPPIRLSNPVAEPAEAPPAAPPPHPRRRRQPWAWPLAGLTGAGMLVGLVLGLTDAPPDPRAGAEAPPASAVAAGPPAMPSTRPPPPQVATALPPAVAVPRLEAAPPPAPAASSPAAVAPAVATPAPRPAPVAGLPQVQVRSPANLRAAPDNRAAVLRTAPAGEVFRVHGEAASGWVQVGGAAPEGWIFGKLLSDRP